MPKLNYPSKPWSDGQLAYLMTGLQFAYSASLKKWVPITPGTSTENQIEAAFGVRTAAEVEVLFTDVDTIKTDLNTIKADNAALGVDLSARGKIWKTEQRPSTTEVNNNDVWIDQVSAKLFFYNQSEDVWIQLLPTV